MRPFAAVALLALAGACRTHPAAAPHQTFAKSAFGVYHLSAPTNAPKALARALAEKAGMQVLDATPAAAPLKPTLALFTPKLDELQLPDAEAVQQRSRGLSKGDQARLLHPDSLTILSLTAPPADRLRSYHAELALVRELAAKSDGVIYDVATDWFWSAAEFAKLLDGWTDDIPDERKQVMIGIYRDGELMRLTSMGMEKFGLLNLTVAGVADHDSEAMASVMNVVLQTFLERGETAQPGELRLSIATLRNERIRKELQASFKKGGTGTATVRLTPATGANGDPRLELAFPGSPDTLQIRHNELLTQLFGAEDGTVRVDHDAELLAASRRAKNALAKIKPRFNPKPPTGERLLVKAPFATMDGGTEWMWVEVVRWEGKKILGILDNEPDKVPALKAGARVQVDEDSLFDYILAHGDGTTEGNETGKILSAKAKARE